MIPKLRIENENPDKRWGNHSFVINIDIAPFTRPPESLEISVQRPVGLGEKALPQLESVAE